MPYRSKEPVPGEESELEVPDAFGIAQPMAGKPSIPFPVPHSNVEPGPAPQPSSVSSPVTLSHLSITPKAVSPLSSVQREADG